ncbi:hypothetical protein DFH09DRAFT_1166154 [Mycena vulgaris]|nr:hypothetical protein DFH09DRAFT_1166154 [Mycena vulgaris]
MSTAQIREKRPKKPPACNACKARRVLCHPQLNGAPCPRCVEKDVVCITTHVPRGRPRKGPIPASLPIATSQPMPQASSLAMTSTSEFSTQFLQLTPEFVAHCFECLKYIPQHNHPLIAVTEIKFAVRSVSFQLDHLPPQSRVLALCIVAFSSLASFHEYVLGAGPRPESFEDASFFSSRSNVLACGARRVATCRTLRGEALKAAWDIGIILQPSIENAASCFLLDILEQSDVCSGMSRPWATAYIAHIRALAPTWRASTYTASDEARWAGFLCCCSLSLLISFSHPLMRIASTLNDQFLLCGPEPSSLEAFLASLEKASQKPGLSLLWSSMKPYLFHVTCLARQLSETINGDYPRLNPLSESAAIQFLSALSLLHSVLSLLLDRVDAALTSHANTASPFLLDPANQDSVARACAYGVILSFTNLVLAFHHELEHRATNADAAAPRTRERISLLRGQAHEMAALGAHEFARAVRYLPTIHYAPVYWHSVYAWAEFCAAQPDVVPAEDLQTIMDELKLMGYSLDLSVPHAAALIARLDGHVGTGTRAPTPTFFDPAVLDMFLPLEDAWMDSDTLLLP